MWTLKRAALLAEVVEGLVAVGEDRAAVLAGEGRDLAVRAGLRVVDPDVARDGRRVVLAPRVLAALLVVVEQELAVAAELHVLGGRREQLDRAAAGGGHLVELGLRAGREQAVRGGVHARGAEDDGRVVAGEGVGVLGGGVERQPPRLAALGGHDEDVEVAVAVARERDLPAVVAPDGHEVVGLVRGQRDGRAAGGRHPVEVALVGEDDGLAVRRDRRIAQPAGVGLGGGGSTECEDADEREDACLHIGVIVALRRGSLRLRSGRESLDLHSCGIILPAAQQRGGLMFAAGTYADRRARLAAAVQSGVLLFLGNDESPMNYTDNTYHFRQDSTVAVLLRHRPSRAVPRVIDLDEAADGRLRRRPHARRHRLDRPAADGRRTGGARRRHARARRRRALADVPRRARSGGRPVHYLPPYRDEHRLALSRAARHRPVSRATLAPASPSSAPSSTCASQERRGGRRDRARGRHVGGHAPGGDGDGAPGHAGERHRGAASRRSRWRPAATCRSR